MAKGGARDGAGRKPGVPNKATADVKEAAQQYTTQALKTLSTIMADEQQPAAARVSAATAILDRGHGKPKQSVDMAAAVTGTIREIRRTVVDPHNTDAKSIPPPP